MEAPRGILPAFGHPSMDAMRALNCASPPVASVAEPLAALEGRGRIRLPESMPVRKQGTGDIDLGSILEES